MKNLNQTLNKKSTIKSLTKCLANFLSIGLLSLNFNALAMENNLATENNQAKELSQAMQLNLAKEAKPNPTAVLYDAQKNYYRQKITSFAKQHKFSNSQAYKDFVLANLKLSYKTYLKDSGELKLDPLNISNKSEKNINDIDLSCIAFDQNNQAISTISYNTIPEEILPHANLELKEVILNPLKLVKPANEVKVIHCVISSFNSFTKLTKLKTSDVETNTAP